MAIPTDRRRVFRDAFQSVDSGRVVGFNAAQH